MILEPRGIPFSQDFIGLTMVIAGEGALGEPRMILRLESGNESSPQDHKRSERIDDFLQTVYLLCEVGETRRGIDLIFDRFNDLFRARELDECAETLGKVDLDQIDSTLMVAFLSITLPVKKEMRARQAFFMGVREKLMKERGKDKTSRLLDKYA